MKISDILIKSTKTLVMTTIILVTTWGFSQDFMMTETARVNISTGSYIVLAGDGNFILEADSLQSASLIDYNPVSHIDFSGTGEALAELYLKENQWHYVSSPVADALSGVFMNIYLKEFNEEDSSWVYILPVDSALHPMKGYAAYASDALTGSTTVAFNGDLNTGDFTATLTNHGTAGHNSKGFNFVGNPFPCAINWQLSEPAWTRDNIDPTIYLWNPKAGQYGVYNRITKIGTHDVDSIIPSRQGFFVHVTSSGTGTLGIANDAKLHHQKEFFKSGTLYDYSQLLKLTVNGNGYSDESIIRFDENAAFDFDDQLDAYKIRGLFDAPQLFTRTGQSDFAVNTLREITEYLSIPLHFECGFSTNYTLIAENTLSFDQGVDIYLEDKKLDEFHDLRVNHNYEFSANPADDDNRFMIHFFEPELGINEILYQFPIRIYTFNREIIIEIPEGESGSAMIVDVTGTLIRSVQLTESQTRIDNLRSNFYIVKAIAKECSQTEKIILH